MIAVTPLSQSLSVNLADVVEGDSHTSGLPATVFCAKFPQKYPSRKGVVMSIYDDPFDDDAKKPASQPLDLAQGNEATNGPIPGAGDLPKPIIETKSTDGDDPESAPPKRRGCGCGSCLLAIFILGIVSILVCGIGGYVGYRNFPEWTHKVIVSAVDDSELDDQAKQDIKVQMDRLLKEYRAGNISNERFLEGLEELGDSPIFLLLMSYAAMESYIAPSGLSDDEKADAKLVFQRVARGTFEKKIKADDLEQAFSYISEKDFNGNRQVKNNVPDEDLRSLVKECRRVADEAGIPNEPYQVDVAAEVKRIVDRALGIVPAEESEPQTVEPNKSDPDPGRADQPESDQPETDQIEVRPAKTEPTDASTATVSPGQ